jgi:hypothetical protein
VFGWQDRARLLVSRVGMRPLEPLISSSSRAPAFAHKPIAVQSHQNERGSKTRPCQLPHPSLSQWHYSNSCSGRAIAASAVISTRLSVCHLLLPCTPPHLVFPLCEIDLRPRRPRTWCHLSLAPCSDDHWQAYSPIGFTNSTPKHAVPCCMRTIGDASLLPVLGSYRPNRRHAH